MQVVLSKEQAKAITGGRTPLVPVEYEAAVTALQACVTLDEAKYWDDKAEALAAWARIYRNDEAGVEAKRLKLHAYRRMGELAHQLRPKKPGAIKGAPAGSGNPKGVPSLLVEKGLMLHQANSASAAAKMPKRRFDELVNSPRPPGPSALLKRFERDDVSEAWKIISGVQGGNSLTGMSGWCRGKDAKALARALSAGEASKARKAVVEITEWLDEFEQHLPKARP